MGVPRSWFYDAADADMSDDTALVARMQAIQDEHPAYGYRRITAELRAQGTLANHKRVARLMRLNSMQIRPRRRYVATTDSNHDGPIFPNLAKDLKLDGPDQLWVSDITFVAIATGFVYLAVILDAWSTSFAACLSNPIRASKYRDHRNWVKDFPAGAFSHFPAKTLRQIPSEIFLGALFVLGPNRQEPQREKVQANC